MKKTAAILIGIVFLSGCSTDGKFVKRKTLNSCGSTGYTLTAILYGDSHIVVIPMSEVVAGAEFRFALVSELGGRGSKSFDNATVKIRGKRSPEDDWFTEISGTASDKTISTCIDSSLVVGDTVEYDVEVGFPAEPRPRATLDPRAKVITNPN